MPHHMKKHLVPLTLLMGLALPASAQHAHHEHGIIRLDVALDGPDLQVMLQSPLDSFVGFERAPRTDAEKKRAADALSMLRSHKLLLPNPEARCTLASAEVNAPVLEGKAREKNGHADLEATYNFKCQQAELLTSLDTRYFETFKYTKKVEAQVAGPKGQSKVSLRKNSTQIKLN